MSTRHGLQRSILVLGLIVLVAAFIAASDALHARSADFLALAEDVIARYPRLGMLLFVLLAMISAMLAFFSSAIIVPVGVYAWGSVVCLALLWAGWLLGGMTAYAIARFLGRSIAARLVGESRFSTFERRLGGRLRFIHVLVFQLTLPSEIPGYVLGALRFRFPLYVAALALSELPYALGTVYLGTMFLQRNTTLLLLVGLAAVGLSVVAFRIYRALSSRLRSKP